MPKTSKNETENEAGVALYRKYRPQNFKEIIGQDHVVEALKGAISEGNISHAYIFAGSRGTGKTSIARIFAREIGTSNDDLYEIDAASNNGVDEVRALKEAVNTLPFNSKHKVYILDEVHMFSKSAFNALLKTLEEPPAHVIFILATTEIEKLPETVVSRCQCFTFKKPNRATLKKMVSEVASKEGFALEPSSADLIALLGDGSFRDSHGILQKVLSASSDKTVSVEEVEKITGAPKKKLIEDFVGAVAYKKADQGLKAIRKAADQNMDMKVFLKLALEKMRSAMLVRFSPDLKKEIEKDMSEEDVLLLEKLAGDKEAVLSSQSLLELLNAFDLIGHAAIPELPLELAILRISGQN